MASKAFINYVKQLVIETIILKIGNHIIDVNFIDILAPEFKLARGFFLSLESKFPYDEQGLLMHFLLSYRMILFNNTVTLLKNY